MKKHIDAHLFPFYVNKTLNESESAQIDAHFQECAACRQALVTWNEIANAMVADQGVLSVPQLSPLVQANSNFQPSLRQAVSSAVRLIWSQRVFIIKTWLLPSLGSLIGSAALVVFINRHLAENWVNIPLFAVVPIAAALTTAFLNTFEDDPTSELIAALPTSLATLLFARLSLALGIIGLMGFTGSVLATLLGQVPSSLLGMIGIWLGPMLLISAVTTVFSLRMHPRIASGAALGLWGGLLCLLFSEQLGTPLIKVSLLWLLQPGWALFAAQVLLAGLLWLGTWLWLKGHPPTHNWSEGRS